MLHKVLSFLSNHKPYLISFAIQIALAGFFIHSWDGFVFIKSAGQFLEGLSPYQVALEAPAYTFHGGFQQWYAYPPLPLLMFSSTYAPGHFFFTDNPFIARILIKLPFILGTLLAAYLAYRFVTGVSSPEKGLMAKKLILYNPFLIFISAVWGMFDIWIVNFLLLSLLSLRGNRTGLAGVFFGLSVLVKPYALIFLPAIMAHIWGRAHIRNTFAFGFFALLVFVSVSLPFFISCPEGFIHQVVTMHLERPGSGWGPVAGLCSLAAATKIDIIGTSLGFHSSILLFSTVSLALSVFCLALWYLWIARRSERGLLAILFLTILAFIIFNKTVGPQYFVIPVTLAIVIGQSYTSYPLINTGNVTRYSKFMAIPSAIAGCFAAMLLVDFVAPDFAVFLLGEPTSELIRSIATILPFSHLHSLILVIIAGLLLSPAVITSIIIEINALKEVIPAIATRASSYAMRLVAITYRTHAVEKSLTIIFIFILIMGPPSAFVAGARMEKQDQPIAPPLSFDEKDKMVGTIYHFWHDLTRDPQTRQGDWSKAILTPEDGYYDTTSRYITEDIIQMKQAGIDFAVLSLSEPQDMKKYSIFLEEAEDEGFHFAPLINLADIDPEANEVTGYIQIALRAKKSPSFLQYKGKPVLLINQRPSNPDWGKIRKRVEDEAGKLWWIGSCKDISGEHIEENFLKFDALYPYPLSSLWKPDKNAKENLETLKSQLDLLHNKSEQHNSISIAPTTPCFRDKRVAIPARTKVNGEYKYTYDLLWQAVMDSNANMVLISDWNGYDNSCAIEPTQEFGDIFLQKTKGWCSRFHGKAHQQ